MATATASSTDVTLVVDQTHGTSDYQSANDIVQTSDGGYLLAGLSDQTGSNDAFLVKTGSQGAKQWSRNYGGGGLDFALGTARAGDGGFVFAGVNYTAETDGDAWLGKVDSSGTLQWQRTYGGGAKDRAVDVIHTDDGGFLMVGKSKSYGAHGKYAWALKVDESGTEEWNRTYSADAFKAVLQRSDGGYMAAGDQLGDLWIAWLSSDGTLAGSSSKHASAASEVARDITPTGDGGYAAVSPRGGNISVLKIDDTADFQWNETYDVGGYEMGKAIQQAADGGLLIWGKTDVEDTGDVVRIEAASDGTKESSTVFSKDGFQSPDAVAGPAFAGESETDAWLAVPAPDILNEESVEISPYPVETGESPTVSVHAPGAQSVSISVSVEGGSTYTRDMDYEGNGKWAVTLDSRSTPGTRVELTVTADATGTPSQSVSTFRNEYIERELPLRYYTFDEVRRTAVILTEFSDQPRSSTQFADSGNLSAWKEAKAVAVNDYLGSNNGTMGAVGYQFDYWDNGGDFFTVDSFESYNGSSNGGEQYLDDVETTADGSVTFSAYDLRIATHPNGSSVLPDNAIANYDSCLVRNPTHSCQYDVPRIYVPMTHPVGTHGIWAHELGHDIGFGDLYAHGDIDSDRALMSDAATFSERPKPLILVTRTGENTPLLRGGPTLTEQTVHDLDDIPASGRDITVEPLSTYELDDSTPIVRGSRPDKNVTYFFEARSRRGSTRFLPVHVYKKTDGIGPGMSITRLEPTTGGSLLEETDQRITDRVGPIDPVWVNVSIAEKSGSGRSFDATVNVTRESRQGVIGGTLETAARLAPGSRSLRAYDNVTMPDHDLKAVDSQGRVVGVNHTTGEFVNEIPGAEASGDRELGTEWITVPDNTSVEFYVEVDDVETFLNETDVTRENLTITSRSSVTRYENGSAVTTTGGDVTVTNATTKARTVDVTPGANETILTADAIDVASITPDPNGTDAEYLANETITLENREESSVDLSNVTISDEDGNTFEFPSSFSLDGGDTVTIHTGNGTNTSSDRYWNASAPVWDNGGETITIENQTDTIVSARYDSEGVLYYSSLFRTTNYTISPRQPAAGDNITVSATVHNDGTVGETNVSLYGDGEQRDNRTISITAGGARDVTFNTSFSAQGSHEVRFEDRSSVEVLVDSTPPTAAASVDESTRGVSTPVRFQAYSSTDNVAIKRIEWAFGDGVNATGTDVSHTYASPGNYTVTVNVTDAVGFTNSTTLNATVEDLTPPTAVAGQNVSGTTGSAVSFSAVNSTDNIGIESYEWAFGDGSTATGENVSHSYSSSGNYTVTLTVTDGNGNTASDSLTATIEADNSDGGIAAPLPSGSGSDDESEDSTVNETNDTTSSSTTDNETEAPEETTNESENTGKTSESKGNRKADEASNDDGLPGFGIIQTIVVVVIVLCRQRVAK